MPEQEVWLYQYDLTNGIGPKICKFMTGIEIEGVWHTSLVVFGREYFFGGGIQSGIPGLTPYGTPLKKTLYGKTTKTKKEFENYLDSIDNIYNAENYHIYKNNCNHFTNAIAKYLCNKPLPEDIVDQYKTLQGTPFGDYIISTLDRINEQNKAKTIVPDIFEGKKEEEKKEEEKK